MPALSSQLQLKALTLHTFGSQLCHCILNNLNKPGGHNASAILSLSLVRWAVGPNPGGELEPRAPSEPGHGWVGTPPQEGDYTVVVLPVALVQVGHVAGGLPGLCPHRHAHLLPAGLQLLQAGGITGSITRLYKTGVGGLVGGCQKLPSQPCSAERCSPAQVELAGLWP